MRSSEPNLKSQVYSGVLCRAPEHLEVANRLTTTAKADKIEFLHDEGGYNYRLTNILAALGVAQLEKLKEYVEAKRNIARRYAALFADCDEIHIPPSLPNVKARSGSIL